ncbi:MAG TPA: ABC transporter ATP-binding protein [Candidatus Sulfomarinibacteraceae bacterium]|nr:ABC transporter ATP-binding protein [Candidatus Sulfomarinibacteraceae bacterium]
MPETMVRCHQLEKSFGDVSVVRKVTFTVPTGQILALLGPSGCGKTTTLRLIAGFEPLDAGWIEIAGKTVADERTHVPPEKRRAGMVFQDYAIFPHLTVAQNIAFGLNRHPLAGERTEAMLDLVGLAGLEEQMPHELSGGQQQRVALARALALEPAVLLMDEPFSNLDTSLRLQVRAEVRQLLKKSQATAVFVTHDQEEALFIGDRVAVMNEGRIEQIATPEDVFLRPATRFVAEFMGHSDFVGGRVTQSGVETPLGLLPQRLSLPADSKVEVLVRPDDVEIAEATNGESSNARVQMRQFVGIANIYHLRLNDGTLVRSRQPHTRLFAEGREVRARFTDEHPLPCFHEGRAIYG